MLSNTVNAFPTKHIRSTSINTVNIANPSVMNVKTNVDCELPAEMTTTHIKVPRL
jgi:hypothetical protein